MKIIVLSTYDLMPVRDGGQTRYINIYSHLSKNHDITAIVYDYRQPDRIKRYQLNPHFKVIVPPVAEADAMLFWEYLQRSSRLTHDANCIRRYQFSPEFHHELQRAVAHCDITIASHPYLALVAFGYSPDRTLKVYEAHNVEYDAREVYYRGATDTEVTHRLLQDVRYGEGLAAHEAHYVTTVSANDADRLCELYNIPRSKITVVPNGVDTAAYPRLDRLQRQQLRNRLTRCRNPLGVFIGSAYSPNVEAYIRIRGMLAEAGFSGTIVVIGAVKDAMPTDLPSTRFEERWLGFVPEERKIRLLSCADFALQLMFSGGGTNLKLFDYMAARVLIAGNSFGTRGVSGDGWFWPVDGVDDLRNFLEREAWTTEQGEQIVCRARALAEEQFDWEVITRTFDRLLVYGTGPLGKAMAAFTGQGEGGLLDRAKMA